MIELEATGLGMRFHRHWVFRGLDLKLRSGQRLLLTGPNGSGKSTLMRILAGQVAPSSGQLSLSLEGKPLDPEQWYRHISWSGPYHELYGELSLAETLRMHFRFKQPLIPIPDIARALQLHTHLDKPIRHFSSGMAHRAKVGLAIFSVSHLLLLDEATTNMDADNSRLVMDLLDEHLGDRALLYASNNPAEFGAFVERVDLG